MKFLSLEGLFICMEYCCHVWVGAFNYYLDMLDKLGKHIYRTVRPLIAAFHEPLTHRRTLVV